MKKVVVVILNYKVKKYVLKCVESVIESTYKNLEIILVDNNSEDGIEKEIKKYEGVEFIQNHDNLGYTGGNNVGIKKGLADGIEVVFILNPDTTVKKDTIEILVKNLEIDDVGIIGPKIYFADSKKIWYAGGIFDRANVIGKHKGVDGEDLGQYDEISETDYVTGAAMMVRSEVFDKIGFFDERYFLYYEDSDFCLRAKDAGFKIMYIPEAKVFHENAKSTDLGSSLQDYFITRNRMLFASKFLPMRTRFALLREALRNVSNPVRRLALFDFLIGRFGKGGYLK